MMAESKNITNVLVVTHNSRLRCFLSSISGGKPTKRFKNAAILKLTLKLDLNKDYNQNEYNIELFYVGELNEKKEIDVTKVTNKYYTKPRIDNLEKEISLGSPSDTSLGDRIKDIIFKLKAEGKQEIHMYIVRHAEGEHNTNNNKYKSWINRLTSILQIPMHIDPVLSQIGQTQAEAAGIELKHVKFDYVFSSELKRTRQTARIILDNSLDKNKSQLIYPLQCLHEVSDYAYGKCDDFKLNSNLIRAPENKSKCFNPKYHVKDECTEFNTVWSIYNYELKNKIKCNNTNLLYNVLSGMFFYNKYKESKIVHL